MNTYNKKINTCTYSCGSLNPHQTCNHKKYCIFDSKRIMLEKELVYVKNKIDETLHDYKFIQMEGTINGKDYKEVKRKLKDLQEDYDKLVKYEQKHIYQIGKKA